MMIASLLSLALAPLPTAPAVSDRSAIAKPPFAFILSCTCATRTERERIATAARRKGGRVLYIYDHLKGLAVAAPRHGRIVAFERALRRIPGVISVQPDGMMHTTGQNRTTTLAR